MTAEQEGVFVGNGFNFNIANDRVTISKNGSQITFPVNRLKGVIEEIEVGTNPITGMPMDEIVDFSEEDFNDTYNPAVDSNLVNHNW